MLLAGISIYFILKILAISICVLAIIWSYLKFVGANESADSVDKAGGKLLDIFGIIIKYVFYAIVILIIIVIANIF